MQKSGGKSQVLAGKYGRLSKNSRIWPNIGVEILYLLGHWSQNRGHRMFNDFGQEEMLIFWGLKYSPLFWTHGAFLCISKPAGWGGGGGESRFLSTTVRRCGPLYLFF